MICGTCGTVNVMLPHYKTMLHVSVIVLILI